MKDQRIRGRVNLTRAESPRCARGAPTEPSSVSRPTNDSDPLRDRARAGGWRSATSLGYSGLGATLESGVGAPMMRAAAAEPTRASGYGVIAKHGGIERSAVIGAALVFLAPISRVREGLLPTDPRSVSGRQFLFQRPARAGWPRARIATLLRRFAWTCSLELGRSGAMMRC